MILDECREKRIKRVTNMTLAQARDLIAKTLDHSDMELEFDKAVWMLLNCADEKINGGWIPVTERLPEDKQRILVTRKSGTIGYISWNTWWNEQTRYPIDKVIAWMPLPEPYKGGE